MCFGCFEEERLEFFCAFSIVVSLLSFASKHLSSASILNHKNSWTEFEAKLVNLEDSDCIDICELERRYEKRQVAILGR